MRRAAAARRRLLFWQNLVGQLPPPLLTPLTVVFNYRNKSNIKLLTETASARSLQTYCNNVKGFVNILWYVALMFCDKNKRIFLSVAIANSKQNETTAVLIFEILIIKRKSIRFCKSFWPLTYWIPWFSIKSGTMCLENSSNYIVACQSRKQCRRLALKINIITKWIFIKIEFQDFVQVCKWE